MAKASRKAQAGNPRFEALTDREVRAAYAQKFKRIANLCTMAWEQLETAEVGSDRWNRFASKIDKVYDALGRWDSARRARMLLLTSVDEAVHHATRVRQNRNAVERADLFGDLDVPALKDIALTVPTYFKAKTFVAAGNDLSARAAFAAFLFRDIRPDYSGALQTDPVPRLLAELVEAWQRKSRPRKGASVQRKWELAAVLCQHLGLEGAISDTLQAEWREWRRGRQGASQRST